MPYLHDAWTLLRYCGADARVTHLQRVIPPTQMEWFNKKYDAQIRTAYSHILGINNIPEWSWEIQKLPPQLGGIMLRTGKGISATKYCQSLASSTPNISKFTKNWNPVKTFKLEASKTLEKDLDADISPEVFIDSLVKGARSKKTENKGIHGLEALGQSLLRITETRAQNRIFESLTEDKKLWVMANSGETQTWTQMLPLTHLDNALTNFEFRAIFKRRARLPVYPGA